MKKPIVFLLLFLSSVLSSAAQNIVTVADNGDQLVCVVTVAGIKEKKAVESAESLLRYALFFRGLSDSQSCKTALVGTDEHFAAKHPEYFREMFERNRFSTFISNINFLNYTKKNKVSEIEFTVNIKALKLDLEQQGVKRRFGF